MPMSGRPGPDRCLKAERGTGASSNAGRPSAALSTRPRPLTTSAYLPNWKVARILSTMENDRVQHNPDDPRSVLAGADQARQRLAAGLRLPTGLHPALAAAVAVQVGTGAYGIATQTAAGLAVALAGVAVSLGVAALTLYQFRRINGVRVYGLTGQTIDSDAVDPPELVERERGHAQGDRHPSQRHREPGGRLSGDPVGGGAHLDRDRGGERRVQAGRQP